MKNLKNLLQEVRKQAKATIALFLVGGIDVIANILQIVIYAVIQTMVEPSRKLFVLVFAYQLIENGILLCEVLVYGLYMKKIRNRLPNWIVCYR